MDYDERRNLINYRVDVCIFIGVYIQPDCILAAIIMAHESWTESWVTSEWQGSSLVTYVAHTHRTTMNSDNVFVMKERERKSVAFIVHMTTLYIYTINSIDWRCHFFHTTLSFCSMLVVSIGHDFVRGGCTKNVYRFLLKGYHARE